MYSAFCKILLLASFALLTTPAAGSQTGANFKDLGIPLISSIPAVVASGPIDNPNRLTFFVRSSDNTLGYRDVTFNSDAQTATWANFESLGGGICSNPSGVRYPNGVMSFVFGMNNNMYSRYKHDNGGWSGYEHHGGVCYGSPSSSWIGSVHTFVRGTDNACWVRWGTPGGGWGGFGSFGGVIVSNPTTVGFQPQRGQIRGLVAVTGTDNKIYHRMWNGGAWADWSCLEGKSAGDPVLIANSPRPEWNAFATVELYIRTSEGQLTRRCFDGDIWQDWDAMPFKLWRDFSAINIKNGTIFYINKEGRVHAHTYALPT